MNGKGLLTSGKHEFALVSALRTAKKPIRLECSVPPFLTHFVPLIFCFQIRYGEMKDKQSKVDHVRRLSQQIENETLDPTISQPFLKEAEALDERWSKIKEMIESYGEKDAGSKASSSNCCGAFLKKRLFPIWSYN